MGLKDKILKKNQEMWFDKNKDRMTGVQGSVLSVKITEKTVFFIYHKLIVSIIIKPERSKAVVKCIYEAKKFFKKPTCIAVNQGNSVSIQGLKGGKVKDTIEVLNIINFTTKKELIPLDADQLKQMKQVQKFR
jgi:tyrosine-protein phosphatase YwqE